MTHINGKGPWSRTSCLVSSQNAGHGGTRHCSRGGGDIDTLGGLSTTGMVSAASILAGRTGALVDTLIVGLGADVIGHGLGVFRRIGGGMVTADALVGQGLLEGSVWIIETGVEDVLTGEQVFVRGDPEVPGTCRQSSGQEDVWDWHHASGGR